jgi:hypothetical protein
MSTLPAHILAVLSGQYTAIVETVTDTNKPHIAKGKEEKEPTLSVGALTELPELETHSLEGDNVIWED